MIWLIGLGVWSAVAVAVSLVLGPVLKRCSQEPPGSSETEDL